MATHDHTGNADEITPQARTLTFLSTGESAFIMCLRMTLCDSYGQQDVVDRFQQRPGVSSRRRLLA
jgi:hypothetical protein